jgi:hypothetical protein
MPTVKARRYIDLPFPMAPHHRGFRNGEDAPSRLSVGPLFVGKMILENYTTEMLYSMFAIRWLRTSGALPNRECIVPACSGLICRMTCHLCGKTRLLVPFYTTEMLYSMFAIRWLRTSGALPMGEIARKVKP